MSRSGKILPLLALVAIVASLVLVLHDHQTEVTNAVSVPGLSIPGKTPCENFLRETQEGGSAVAPLFGKVTEQAIRAYVLQYVVQSAASSTAIAHIWYFDCGSRTFYYVELNGEYYPVSSPNGAPIRTYQHQYILFDAKTGNILSVRSSN